MVKCNGSAQDLNYCDTASVQEKKTKVPVKGLYGIQSCGGQTEKKSKKTSKPQKHSNGSVCTLMKGGGRGNRDCIRR